LNKLLLTTTKSIGNGAINFDLYRSFTNSLTKNITNMVTIAITNAAMLVDEIFDIILMISF
jgi:hypothetical protein